MKKLSDLLLLLVLLFSVTTALSADGLEPSNLFAQATMETTISQNMGGLAVLSDSERAAALAESILCPEYNAADMAFLYMVSGNYINCGYEKLFVHPAVLGIC